MVELSGEVYRLGDTIHGQRVKAGYKTVAKFSEAIEAHTGIAIPKDTLQRIESGRQEPKTSQYIAIAITLGLLHDPLLVESLPLRLRAARAKVLETSTAAIGALDYVEDLKTDLIKHENAFIRNNPNFPTDNGGRAGMDGHSYALKSNHGGYTF